MLSSDAINITILLGESDAFEEIKLEIEYRVEKRWLMNVRLNPKFTPRDTEVGRTIQYSRGFTILFAVILALLETHQLSESLKDEDITVKRQFFWPVATIAMCFLIILSRTLSPLLSLLMLLPYL